MKTSRHSARSGALLAAFLICAPAAAFNRFECLRDLMLVTEQGVMQMARKGLDQPFLINGKYLVFPEVNAGQVSGFYIYDRSRAWHYDAVERAGRIPISSLAFETATGMFELVAQPNGLETVTIHYLPGYDPNETNNEGAAMLGSSVLPVVGAFVSRPARRKTYYYNPSTASAGELKTWMVKRSASRLPADEKSLTLKRTLTPMLASTGRMDLWRPLNQELELRRTWIRTHNLDESAFKQFSRAMETTCKPGA